jgi:hypothetical protein
MMTGGCCCCCCCCLQAKPYLAVQNATSSDSNPPSGTWVQRGQDKVVTRIEDRISDWMGAPVENGEPMHVRK